jgi:hypothetical protein
MKISRHKFNQHSMKTALRLSTALLLLTPVGILAQAGGGKVSPVDALPQDSGAAGLTLDFRRLQTTGRLLQIDAHPDDEDGGMLTLESRGKAPALPC